MGVEDRGAEGVRVELKGFAPVSGCCQKAATKGHTCVGLFVTGF